MPPAVSIIVPTYNRLRFLRKTLATVFEQTFEDWELLIADDGSSGETRAYLESIEDAPRTRVLWLPHTGKPSAARNAALREAKGEYIALLDSDDLWVPEKLQIQLASLRRGGRRWGYTRFVLVDESGNPTAWQRARNWPVPDGWIYDRLVRSETVIAVPSVVVSRKLLEQVGGFDEDLVMCEDYDLWLRLAAQGEVDAIDEPCTLVTRHSEHSGSEIISFQDCARVFDKVLRRPGTEHLHSIVHEKLAEVSYGLAKSQATSGHRVGAVLTLASSMHLCWRYPHWWMGALRAAAYALAPQSAIRAVRRYRGGGRAQNAAHP